MDQCSASVARKEPSACCVLLGVDLLARQWASVAVGARIFCLVAFVGLHRSLGHYVLVRGYVVAHSIYGIDCSSTWDLSRGWIVVFGLGRGGVWIDDATA